MRASDLGVCAPSGTRTPNPLKLAVRLLGVLAIALKWPLTWAFADLTTLALAGRFGRFRLDGGGVNRGLRGVGAAGWQRPSVARHGFDLRLDGRKHDDEECRHRAEQHGSEKPPESAPSLALREAPALMSARVPQPMAPSV